MTEAPNQITIELEEKDVREDLPQIVNDMSRMRAETIKNRQLTDAQKDEYLHLAYRLASGMEAVADEQIAGRMRIVAETLNRNSDLLSYDPMQDAHWKKSEQRFAETLDDLLIGVVKDDFHNADAKHHILQAVKYLATHGSDGEERERVFDTMLPFHKPVPLKRDSLRKRIATCLFGYQYNSQSLENLTLRVDATSQGFSEELVDTARDRGYTALQVDVSEQELFEPEGSLQVGYKVKIVKNDSLGWNEKYFEDRTKSFPINSEGVITEITSKGNAIVKFSGLRIHSRSDDWAEENKYWESRNKNAAIFNTRELNSLEPKRVKDRFQKLEAVIIESDIKPTPTDGLMNRVIKYTKPITYLVVGALPRSIQERFGRKYKDYSTEDAFEISSMLEAGSGVIGAIAGGVTAACMGRWDVAISIPAGILMLIDGASRGANSQRKISENKNVYDHPVGSFFLKPFVYAFEPRDRSRKFYRIEIPLRKVEASEQVPNPIQFYDTVGRLQVPEDVEKNLVWDTTNHHLFGKSFLSYLEEHCGEKPKGITISAEIDKPNQAVVYNYELQVNGHCKHSALFCFKDRRYMITSVNLTNGTNCFAHNTAKILSSNSNASDAMKELGKEAGARYVHLREYRGGEIVNDLEGFG